MARRAVNFNKATSPEVSAILEQGEERKRWQQMTPAQKRRARRDQQRKRTTLELDPDVVRLIQAISEAEDVSPASVVNLLLVKALPAYAAGEIDFTEHTYPARGRYLWGVEIHVNGLAKEVEKAISEKAENSEGYE